MCPSVPSTFGVVHDTGRVPRLFTSHSMTVAPQDVFRMHNQAKGCIMWGGGFQFQLEQGADFLVLVPCQCRLIQ